MSVETRLILDVEISSFMVDATRSASWFSTATLMEFAFGILKEPSENSESNQDCGMCIQCTLDLPPHSVKTISRRIWVMAGERIPHLNIDTIYWTKSGYTCRWTIAHETEPYLGTASIYLHGNFSEYPLLSFRPFYTLALSSILHHLFRPNSAFSLTQNHRLWKKWLCSYQ